MQVQYSGDNENSLFSFWDFLTIPNMPRLEHS